MESKIYLTNFLIFSHVRDVMFTEANGDRPNPPYSNTIILLSGGFSTTPYADIEGFDRKIAIGFGLSISPVLRQFASSLDDYLEPHNACDLRDLLKNRLLCEEIPVTTNSTCPFGSTPWMAG